MRGAHSSTAHPRRGPAPSGSCSQRDGHAIIRNVTGLASLREPSSKLSIDGGGGAALRATETDTATRTGVRRWQHPHALTWAMGDGLTLDSSSGARPDAATRLDAALAGDGTDLDVGGGGGGAATADRRTGVPAELRGVPAELRGVPAERGLNGGSTDAVLGTYATPAACAGAGAGVGAAAGAAAAAAALAELSSALCRMMVTITREAVGTAVSRTPLWPPLY